jgi:hypothetical protein
MLLTKVGISTELGDRHEVCHANSRKEKRGHPGHSISRPADSDFSVVMLAIHQVDEFRAP